jgi:hypothetical protein
VCVHGGRSVKGDRDHPAPLKLRRELRKMNPTDPTDTPTRDAKARENSQVPKNEQAAEERERRLVAALEKLRRVVDRQAEDEGLWPLTPDVATAYIVQELRLLHAAIEDALGQGCDHDWVDPSNEVVEAGEYRLCRNCSLLQKARASTGGMNRLREKLKRAREIREAINGGKEPPFGGFQNRHPLGSRCPACGQPRPNQGR